MKRSYFQLGLMVIMGLVFGVSSGACSKSGSGDTDDRWMVGGGSDDVAAVDAVDVQGLPDGHHTDLRDVSGDSSCRVSDDFRPSSDARTYRQVHDTTGATYICPEAVKPGASRVFTCVREDSRARVRCRVVAGNLDSIEVECQMADQCRFRWRPACESFVKYGDPGSDRHCWNPPENYCKDGGATSIEWYCKPDGSVCCQASTNCFDCGWVRVHSRESCYVAGGGRKDKAFCRNFWQTIEQPYRRCVRGNCSDAGFEKIESHPACKQGGIQKSIRICR